MDPIRSAPRSASGESQRQRTESKTGRYLSRLIALAVVPVFGVAAAIVPASAASASAPGRTAITAESVIVGALGTPRAPRAPSSNFWTYETIHRLSTISDDDDYDFSAKMTHEMEKVTRDALQKRITSVARWLAILAGAINVFVHNHPLAAAIVGFIAAVISVINIKKVATLWKWLKGIIYKGTHRRTNVNNNGFWAKIFTAETDPPQSYQGWTARTCSTDAIRCGSPGDHNKEIWPKG